MASHVLHGIPMYYMATEKCCCESKGLSKDEAPPSICVICYMGRVSRVPKRPRLKKLRGVFPLPPSVYIGVSCHLGLPSRELGSKQVGRFKVMSEDVSHDLEEGCKLRLLRVCSRGV